MTKIFQFIANIIRRERIQFLIIAITILTIFFWRLIFLHESFSPADMLYNYYPWKSLAPSNFTAWNDLRSDDPFLIYPNLSFFWNLIREGYLPLWNPYKLAGQPDFLYHVGIFYPLNFVYLMFPLEQAPGIFVFILLFLGGYFMYIFLSTLGAKHFGSIVGSVVFMLNGVFIVWLSSIIPTVGILLPISLLFIEYFFRSQNIKYVLLFAFILGIALLVGHMPSSVIFISVNGLYFLFKLLTHKANIKIVKYVGLFFASLFIAGLLSASTLIPIYMNYINSPVIMGRTYGLTAHPNPDNIITYLIPDFWGNPIYHNWQAGGNYCEWISYFGILPIFLAFIAMIFYRKNIYVLFFTILALFSLGYVYGVPIINLIGYIPGFMQSSAARWVLASNFSFAILAGFGADFIIRYANDLNIKNRLCSFILIIGGLMLIGLTVVYVKYFAIAIKEIMINNTYLVVILMLGSTIYIGLIYASIKNNITSKILGISSIIFLILTLLIYFILSDMTGDWKIFHIRNIFKFLLLLLASTIILLGYFKNIYKERFFKIAMVIIVSTDLLVFGINFNPTIKSEDFYPLTDGISFLKNDTDHFRIAQIGEFPGILPGDTSVIYGIPTILGFDITANKDYQTFLSYMIGSSSDSINYGNFVNLPYPMIINSSLFDLLNVKYILGDPFIDVYQEKFSRPIGEIHGYIRVGQTFISQHNNLARIDIFLATYAHNLNNQDIIFHLKNNPSDVQDIAMVKINASNVTDNAYYSFEFSPIIDSKGMSFYFYLESPYSSPGNAITIWANDDVYKNGSMYLNDTPIYSTDLKFITYYEDLEKFSLVYKNNDLTIYRNNRYLPRAWIVHQAIKIRNNSDILQYMNSDKFDARSQIVLEDLPLHIADNLDNIDDSNKSYVAITYVAITSYLPNSIKLQVDMKNPGFLVLSERYASGWKAFANGKEVSIYKTDYLLRSVFLDTGKYDVEFMYDPIYVKWSYYISLLTFGILIIGIIILNRHKN